MNLQEIILGWSVFGLRKVASFHTLRHRGRCRYNEPGYDVRVLGPEPWRVAYVEPCRRPTDGRYGEIRTGSTLLSVPGDHSPAPMIFRNIYSQLRSLRHRSRRSRHKVRGGIGIPTIGAWGLGWEVWLDGMEITQFTYFQQVGGIDMDVVPAELTYGIERIAMFVQKVDNIFDLRWVDDVTYGDIHHRGEVEHSIYNFDEADVDMLFKLFNMYEAEAKRLIGKGLVLPAYDYVLKCSHTFNLLDA